MAFHELLKSNEGAQFPTTREMKERAFALLQDVAFDTTIPYADFHAALGLSPDLDHRARSAVLWAGRRLLRERNKKLTNVRRVGYRIIKPDEHVTVSKGEQKRARRWLREALKTVTHVALDELSPTEVAKVMTEQARAAIQVAMTRKLARVKALPSRSDLRLPSSSKLVDMMRAKKS